MGKSAFVSDIKAMTAGTALAAPFLVASREDLVTVKGTDYLKLELADKTGRIPARVWDDTEALGQVLTLGAVCQVTARVDSWKGRVQLAVIGAAPLAESDYDPSDIVKGPPEPLEGLKEKVLQLVGSIEDPDIRALLRETLSRPETAGFWTSPAAKKFHHAYPGGLLEHSLSVARMAMLVAGHYGRAVNRDLLVAGALLHDVGKCQELLGGPAPDYTTEGRLLGHLVIGASILEKAAAALPGFPEEKLLLLRHLLLCHHGEKELGSPVTPHIVEGLILHHLDNLDAKMNVMASSVAEELGGRPMEWTEFNRAADTFILSTPRWGGLPDSDPSASWTLDPREPRAPGGLREDQEGYLEAEAAETGRAKRFFNPPERTPLADPPEPPPDGPRLPEPAMERGRRNVTPETAESAPDATQAPKPRRPSLF
jgi:3'-5' exoribonuclease